MADPIQSGEFITFVRQGGIPVTVVRAGGTYVRVASYGGKPVTYVKYGGFLVYIDREAELPDDIKEEIGY